jgi:uroporphyrinogen decarboxylase
MLTSRSLIKDSLEFNTPTRVPRDLWVLPWAQQHYPTELVEIRRRYPVDIAGAPVHYPTPLPTRGDPYAVGEYTDEWGCTFTNLQEGIIGEVKHPLIATWDDFSQYKPPLRRLTFDRDAVNDFHRTSDHFVLSGCQNGIFERLQFLRGTQNLMIDLAEQPAELFELIQRIHHQFMAEYELWARTDVDAIFFMDDWGAQERLLISPRTWRKIFKPLYKDFIDLAHANGKYAFMHSDGYIQDILPDMVELGLDALNSQLFCMDIEAIGRQFRGRITFWGEVDRQHLLPYGSVEDIHQAVQRVKNALSANGGVIAQCEFGAGTRPENVTAMFQAWEQ